MTNNNNLKPSFTPSPQAVLVPLHQLVLSTWLNNAFAAQKLAKQTSWSLGGRINEYVLVDDWCVGCAVLIDYGHHESDEFGPEVEVLY